MAFVFALLTLMAGISRAQAPLQTELTQNKPAKIEGRLLNAITGEPIRKAMVSLRPSTGGGMTGMGPMAGGKSVATDAEGKFSFENVDAGSYRLSADRQGFLRQEYGSRQQFALGTTLRVGSGDSLSGI